MAGGATSAKVLVAPILALSSFVAEPALRVRATTVHAETAKIAMNADQASETQTNTATGSTASETQALTDTVTKSSMPSETQTITDIGTESGTSSETQMITDIVTETSQVAASGPQSIAVHVETVKTEPKVDAVNAHVVEPQVTTPEQKARAKFPEPTPVNPKLTAAAGSPCQAPWALVNRRWIARFCLFGYGY